MDAGEFIDFASRLSQMPGGGASAYRSSVSRAYYGAFHLARLLLEQLSCDLPIDNAHLFVYRALYNCKVSEARDVATLLNNLKQSRRDADYELTEPMADTKDNAISCVTRADELRSRLKKLDDPKFHDRIKTGVAEYAKTLSGAK